MDMPKLENWLNQLMDRGVPGCEAIVYLDGKQVYRTAHGMASVNRPMGPDALYYIYSCSKVFTAVAGSQLLERGLLRLEDPVCKWLPAYAHAYTLENGTRKEVGDSLLVRHLFTMSAGLDYSLDNEALRRYRDAEGDSADTIGYVNTFIDRPLSFLPGERFQYSLCLDVLGAVIERASGIRFGEYMQKNIFDPLGLKDIGFRPNEEQYARICDQFLIDSSGEVAPTEKRIPNFTLTGSYESGGAGLFASAEALGIFLADLSMGSEPGGSRLLKPETLALMTAPQIGTFVRNPTFPSGGSVGPGYNYGLGVRTLTDTNCSRSRIGEFGWDGAAGSFLLADPRARVAAVYTQHVLLWPARWPDMLAPMRDAVYEDLGL